MRIRIRIGIAIALFALQTLALYWPSAPSGPSSDLPLDKVAHVVMFAVVAFALRWAGLRLWLTITLLVAQMAISETLHHFYASRSGEIGDTLADLVGIAIGLSTHYLLTTRPTRFEKEVT